MTVSEKMFLETVPKYESRGCSWNFVFLLVGLSFDFFKLWVFLGQSNGCSYYSFITFNAYFIRNIITRKIVESFTEQAK